MTNHEPSRRKTIIKAVAVVEGLEARGHRVTRRGEYDVLPVINAARLQPGNQSAASESRMPALEQGAAAL